MNVSSWLCNFWQVSRFAEILMRTKINVYCLIFLLINFIISFNSFNAAKDTTSELSAEVIIKTSSGIKIPFALDEEERNVCGNLLHGAYCPLYATEDATYNLTMQLPNFSGRNIVEVNLVDESENEVIACFTTEILIKRISKKFRI